MKSIITVVENEQQMPEGVFRSRAETKKYVSKLTNKRAFAIRELDIKNFPFYILLFNPPLGSHDIIYTNNGEIAHADSLLDGIISKASESLDLRGMLHVYRIEKPFVCRLDKPLDVDRKFYHLMAVCFPLGDPFRGWMAANPNAC
ncbi:hypothetical protein M2103_001631 [Ereboglobus sp. PH5-5]|uniref:hypothetical protein n=1 Tax=Ereboglobus sp. PH5-5 TaxID=2940529 RepID=UPI00240603B4|nr:hypothetical protein [Ereboglobus sp. PH5-5]MDF9833407.1 hypothetical protein [Ereboglobus sp. PH5-5]